MGSRLRRGGSAQISFFAFQDIITAAAGIMILVTLIMALDMGESSIAPPAEPVQQDPNLEVQQKQLIIQLALAGQTNGQLRNQLAEVQKKPDPKDIQRQIERLTNQIAQAQQQVKKDEEKARAANDSIREEDRRLGLAGLRDQLIQIQAEMMGLSNKVVEAKKQSTVLEEQIRQIQSQLLVVKSNKGQFWLVPDPNATTKEPILVVISGKEIVIERFDRPAERVTLTGQISQEFKAQLKQYNKLNQYFVFFIRPSGIGIFDEIIEFSKDAGFDTGYEPLAESQVIHFSKPKVPETEIPPPPVKAPSGSTKSSSPPSVNDPVTPSVPSPPDPPSTTAAKPQPKPKSAPPAKPVKLTLWQRIKKWLGFSS